MKYKLPNGNELLLGQNIYGVWVVSCWDKELNNVWEMKFDKYSEAEAQFKRSKEIA